MAKKSTQEEPIYKPDGLDKIHPFRTRQATRGKCPSIQTELTNTMADAFVGKFSVEKRENYDGFLKGIGIPAEYIEKARDAKVHTEISKDGDVITVKRTRPAGTTTNSFKLGEETELDTIKGDKIKATINIVGNKLIAKGDDYELVSEFDGEKLKETITTKGHTMSRWSVRS